MINRYIGFLASSVISVAITIIIFVFVLPSQGMQLSDPFVLAFFIVFLAASLFSFRHAFLERKRLGTILDEGNEVTGVVVGFEKDKTRMSGNEYEMVMVLHYFGDDGSVKKAYVPMGSDNLSIFKYPKGTCFDIIVDENSMEAVISGESKEPLKDKALLMSYGLSSASSISSSALRRDFTSCTCPKCGAPLMIANHGTYKCDYCGNLVSYDDFKKEDDIYDVSVQANPMDFRVFGTKKKKSKLLSDNNIPIADDIELSEDIPDIVFSDDNTKKVRKNHG